MTNKKFSKLFGKNPRNPKSEDITQFHMDIYASIQQVTEEIMINWQFLYVMNLRSKIFV